MKYAVVIEKGPESYGAYVPDLLASAVVGETRKEVITDREAQAFTHPCGLVRRTVAG